MLVIEKMFEHHIILLLMNSSKRGFKKNCSNAFSILDQFKPE